MNPKNDELLFWFYRKNPKNLSFNKEHLCLRIYFGVIDTGLLYTQQHSIYIYKYQVGCVVCSCLNDKFNFNILFCFDVMNTNKYCVI